MHIQVSVRTEPATEEHVRLCSSQRTVGLQATQVLGGPHRVVRLVARLGPTRVLTHDHRRSLGTRAFRVVVGELVDASKRHRFVGVVDHCCALEVRGRHCLHFEVEGSPLQPPARMVEIGIYRAGVDHQLVRA